MAQLSYVEMQSTSCRVLDQGKPVGRGNSHVWIKVNNPDDIEPVRSAIVVLAAQQNMTWLKPRHSRTEPGKVVGNSHMTILDASVWTPGRLVFDGCPTVGDGLTVAPLNPVVHVGTSDALDLSAVVLPNESQLREVERRLDVKIKVQGNGLGLKISANDLKLSTSIDTKDHGTLTTQEILERKHADKLPDKPRCQAPFRESSSFAAFVGINADGIPFVYDNGTCTTHWLNKEEQATLQQIHAKGVMNDLQVRVSEDSAAVLEEPSIKAMATIKRSDPAAYHRQRAALKAANPKVPQTEMDRAVKAQVAQDMLAETHHSYAKDLLRELTFNGCAPVTHQSELHALNPATNVWETKPIDSLVRLVADLHDGKPNCSRAGDYRAIADHAVLLATNNDFFHEAAHGVACPGGLYQIVNEQIDLVPLTPEHRQRVMLGFTPADMPTPLFDAFLHDTFGSPNEGEEEEQIRLLQEIAGGIMVGILHKQQRAVLFYEPFGRAGKGTLERQIRELVPSEFVTSITPFKWGQDYHVVTLSAKRLNVVGELPENEAIPAAMFKSVLGGDLITGRHPTHRPLTFTNEAAHLFMSNHLITTKDQGEAFFARWVILEFPNSRLRSGLPLDKGLAQRIIDNELPGIAYWALQGAARLLQQGALSPSRTHDRLMAKWRRNTNSLEEFIHENCVVDANGTYQRARLYQDYTEWCRDSGRKAFAKGRVKELLENNIGMGVRLVERNGYETFLGIAEKSTPIPLHAQHGGF